MRQGLDRALDRASRKDMFSISERLERVLLVSLIHMGVDLY